MNDRLPGMDLRERAFSEEPAPRGQTSRPQRPPRRNGLSVLALVISIVALLLAVTTLALILRDEEKEPDVPPEPVTFRFGDRILTPLEGMPLNPYAPEGFSVDERGRVAYEWNGRKAKAGVDVSTHQKEIDWRAVAADGVDFAMLRLGHRGYSQGGLFRDETFARNLQGALDAGLEVGVYFFSQAVTPEEAEEEAEYVLRVLDGKKLAFPVAFDWESIQEDTARTDGLDGETVTNCAAAFCKRIADAGYRPAVYFNRTQGYLHYDLRELTDYALWLAEYGTTPDFYYHFDLWQYSHTGRVDGIQGNVDLDLAF